MVAACWLSSRSARLPQALESSTVITMAASTPAMHSGLFSTASGLCAGTLVKNKVRVKPTPASTCTAAWQNSI